MNGSEMIEIEVTSSMDGSREKNLFRVPERKTAVPLLVGLHTWSYDRFNQVKNILPFCRERDWALLLPEFRGPNLTTNPRALQGCASSLACQDIMDAVSYICGMHNIDRKRIFLLGGSGGGHMALMMAALSPETWRGVSSWVPITDLAEWTIQNREYAPHVYACCGGKPGESAKIDAEYRARSPIHHADRISRATVSIHHGRYDESVPYSHTVNMALKLEAHKPKESFFEIFDGAHDIRYKTAFDWFDSLTGNHADNKHLTG